MKKLKNHIKTTGRLMTNLLEILIFFPPEFLIELEKMDIQ